MTEEKDTANLRKMINGINAIDRLNETNAFFVENEVIPQLANAAFESCTDEETDIVQEVKGLLENKAIAVVSFPGPQPVDKVQGITLEKQRFAAHGERYTLAFLVNPAVIDKLVPENNESVRLMKELMLDAHKMWKELGSKGQFLPAYEIK